jgi:hypothetical protein
MRIEVLAYKPWLLLQQIKYAYFIATKTTFAICTVLFLQACGGGVSNKSTVTPKSTAVLPAVLVTYNESINSYSLNDLPINLLISKYSPYFELNSGIGSPFLILQGNINCLSNCSLGNPPQIITVSGTVTELVHANSNNNNEITISGLNIPANTLIQDMGSGNALSVWKDIANNPGGLVVQNAGVTFNCPNSNNSPAITSTYANFSLVNFINSCPP